jgi:hypothetical protein
MMTIHYRWVRAILSALQYLQNLHTTILVYCAQLVLCKIRKLYYNGTLSLKNDRAMEQVSVLACFYVKCSSRCLILRTIRILWNDSKLRCWCYIYFSSTVRVTVLFLPALALCCRCLVWYTKLYQVRDFLLVSYLGSWVVMTTFSLTLLLLLLLLLLLFCVNTLNVHFPGVRGLQTQIPVRLFCTNFRNYAAPWPSSILRSFHTFVTYFLELRLKYNVLGRNTRRMIQNRGFHCFPAAYHTDYVHAQYNEHVQIEEWIFTDERPTERTSWSRG